MLLHIPGVLSTSQLATVRSALVDADWVDGRLTAGEQGAQVKRNRQLDPVSALSMRLGDIVQQAVAANAAFLSAALPLRSVAPLFNCHEGGEHYGLHVDGAVRMLSTAQAPLRADLSSTLFLSDPDAYEGGELVVLDTYGEHEVKLPAGDLVLYAASSLHRVAPVTRGRRVCAVLWTQSMVRDDAGRAVLHEMDMSIQQLRARVGDCAEVVSLTAQYHNLLRMWIEV